MAAGVSVHFDLPFRLGRDGSFTVNEQGSDADIQACMLSIVSQRVGYRDDRPELGVHDPVHRQGGADLEEVRQAIDEFEPRAHELISREPTLLNSLVDTVIIDRQP